MTWAQNPPAAIHYYGACRAEQALTVELRRWEHGGDRRTPGVSLYAQLDLHTHVLIDERV